MSEYKLEPADIVFFADASLDRLDEIPAKERMETIRLLTKQMFNDAAKNMRTKTGIPSPNDFPDEYDALTNLAKSFSHSKKFSRTVIQATDRTINHIENDDTALVTLKLWRKVSLDVRKVTLKKIVTHFMNASMTLFDVPFAQPAVVFYHEEKDANGDVTQGYYSDISPEDVTGEVAINTHKDAFFNDVCQAASTALHEAVHAVQDQIGVIGRLRPAFVKPYRHDSQLAIILSQENAIIDHRLDTPYRAQFHERLAFDADERFHRKLKAALSFER